MTIIHIKGLLMKRFELTALAAILFVIVISSCQDVFTTSAFSFVQTDMTTMTDSQKVSYAEDLLSSGTAEELAAAYTQIAALLPADLSTADPDLLILAADLAVGSSGIGDAVSGALAVFSSGEEITEESITEIFDSINTDNLADAVTLIEAAEAGGVELTTEQYTNAAAAQVLVVLDQVEALGVADPSSLDDSIPEQAAIIEELEQALTWAEAGGIDLSLFGGGISLPV